MKRINFTLAILAFLIAPRVSAHNKSDIELSFRSDGSFKIVQFTDIHFSSGDNANDLTLANISRILDNEKPDLVVLTGDIVTSGNPQKGWTELTRPIIEREINWAVTLGNHDSENDFKRDEIIKIVRGLPYNIQQKTLDKISGEGNLAMPIKDTKGKNGAVLYLFDSHAYTTPYLPGYYDWIKRDQIDWYSKSSKAFSDDNNHIALPSVAFFHIPLYEYKYVAEKGDVVGHVNEEVSSSELNSGLFAAMVENGDIMGVFTGHDHNNDFIGTYQDIALAYGRCSGEYAYGDLRLGARVIKLYQREFRFDTWICTPAKTLQHYSYPFQTDKTDTLVMNPAQIVKGKLKQGVSYAYFEGEIESVSQIKELKAKETGTASNFDISKAHVPDHFAFDFRAYIKIPQNGLYQLFLSSDDGAKLFIDDALLIDNDGSHSTSMKKKSIALNEGFHKIRVLYFEDYMGQDLHVGISGSTIRKRDIPNEMLYITE